MKDYRTVPRLFFLTELALLEHNPLSVLVYQLQEFTESAYTGTNIPMLIQTLKTELNNNFDKKQMTLQPISSMVLQQALFSNCENLYSVT